MSREYEATVILGLRFVMGQAVVPRRVLHSCEHEQRIGFRFCSECGARVWTRTEWDEDAEDRLVTRIGGLLPIRYKFVRQDDAEGQPYFLGYGMTHGLSDRGSGFLPPADPEGVRIEVSHILKKAGIAEHHLDEAEFGIHTFVTSY